jgi:hypothetical protein
MEILSALGFNATDPLKKVFQESLRKADNGDGILTKGEYEKATKTVIDSDEFQKLTAGDQNSFKEKLDPDAIWGQQQGVSSVINYDGMQKQIEHYEKLLNDPTRNKGADGKPLVTKEQLEFAKKNGFGDIGGKNGIDGLELAVADIDGKNGIDAKDGDLNKDGKVNKDDRGVDLRSSETSNSNSSNGFDTKKLMAFIQELIKIWAPNIQVPQIAAARTVTPQPSTATPKPSTAT